jgi:predicted transcriptional regulator
MSAYNSRTADKFMIRLPDDMRAQVEAAAGKQFTSMNTFIVQAIAEKLDHDKRQELLLDALAFAATAMRVSEIEGHSE